MPKKKTNGSWAVPKSWPVQDPTRYKPLSWFIPYERNPRTHPPAQVAMLAELIKTHGPDQDIVVDENRIILKGHGRRLAAMLAGLDQFLFLQRFGLSEAEKTAMRIADNQVSLLSGWDRSLVYGEIASLQSQGYDVGLLGFGDAQLVQFTTTPGPPAEFQAFGENIPTKHQCPSCGYKWSGNSAPPPPPAEAPGKRKR